MQNKRKRGKAQGTHFYPLFSNFFLQALSIRYLPNVRFNENLTYTQAFICMADNKQTLASNLNCLAQTQCIWKRQILIAEQPAYTLLAVLLTDFESSEFPSLSAPKPESQICSSS